MYPVSTLRTWRMASYIIRRSTTWTSLTKVCTRTNLGLCLYAERIQNILRAANARPPEYARDSPWLMDIFRCAPCVALHILCAPYLVIVYFSFSAAYLTNHPHELYHFFCLHELITYKNIWARVCASFALTQSAYQSVFYCFEWITNVGGVQIEPPLQQNRVSYVFRRYLSFLFESVFFCLAYTDWIVSD